MFGVIVFNNEYSINLFNIFFLNSTVIKWYILRNYYTYIFLNVTDKKIDIVYTIVILGSKQIKTEAISITIHNLFYINI